MRIGSGNLENPKVFFSSLVCAWKPTNVIHSMHLFAKLLCALLWEMWMWKMLFRTGFDDFFKVFFNFFGNSFRIPSQIALKIHSPILLKINLEMFSVIYLRSPSAILLGISLVLTLKNPSEITFNFFEQLFWDSFSKFLQHILWEVLHNFF